MAGKGELGRSGAGAGGGLGVAVVSDMGPAPARFTIDRGGGVGNHAGAAVGGILAATAWMFTIVSSVGADPI